MPTTAWLSASNTGVLAISESRAQQRLVWLDQHGKDIGQVGIPKDFTYISLSPQGDKLLGVNSQNGAFELWMVDLTRDVSTKVATNAHFPTWSPDGTKFAYSALNGTGADIHVKSLVDIKADGPLLQSPELKAVNSWSPDGRFLVFNKYRTAEQTWQDLWTLPLAGQDRTPTPFAASQAREMDGAVSPDSRWISYMSDETGTPEIYVESFPTPGPKVRVSTGGGQHPVWRQDGRELFYVSEDHMLMSVPMAPGVVLKPSAPRPLFRLPVIGTGRELSISPDGSKFLAVDWDPSRRQNRLSLISSWQDAQKP